MNPITEIRSFTGRYKFLSNEYPSEVYGWADDGSFKQYPTVAEAYAANSTDRVLKDLLMQKFSVEPLRSQLLETGEALLFDAEEPVCGYFVEKMREVLKQNEKTK